MQLVTRLPNGRTAIVESRLLELDRLAKYGDPHSGWRGDETMFVCTIPRTDRLGVSYPGVQVCALDAHMQPYVACEVDGSLQGFVHEALSQLVKGDWRRPGAFDAVERHNAKIDADRVAAHHDLMENELAPKLEWALRRDGADIRNTFVVPSNYRKAV